MEYASLEEFRDRAGYVIDGIWYPRVTSIVSIKAKPALYHYYARMPSMQAADAAKERSAEEGSRVHDAIEAILKGHHPVLDAVTTPAVEAFTEFLRNTHLKPLMIEERLVSRAHRYAGTVDVVAELDGVVGVLDIKTSKAIYRDYAIQTSAYVAALREDASLPQPETSWILRLDQSRTCAQCGGTLRTKGGAIRVTGKGSRSCMHAWGDATGHLELRECADFDKNFSAFLAAKTLWEWEHEALLEQLR